MIKVFVLLSTVIELRALITLPLEDLRRSKYDIVREQFMFFKKNFNSGKISLSKSLEDQGEIVLQIGNNLSGKQN